MGRGIYCCLEAVLYDNSFRNFYNNNQAVCQAQYLNMNPFQAILFGILITASLTAIIPLDTSQIDKHGTAYSAESCNANTVIDFSFSSSTSLSFNSNVGSNPSTLGFLDVTGNQMTYTMADGQLVSQVWLTGFPKTFVFKFVSGSNTVYVAVPIIDNNGAISSTSEPQQTIDLSLANQGVYYGLKSLDTSSDTSISLSAFNILNDISIGKFYSVADTTSMTTLLIAKIHYKFTRDLGSSAGSVLFTPATFSGLPSSTGDILCWGSQSGYGFFQTHMRESVPLWTFLVATLFFWLFILLSSEVTPEVYERSFRNNKWTCWSMYSIFWLCHEEWFTRTSRTSLILINFYWQGMVAAAIYYHQWQNSNSTILIWVGVVAFVASIPVPYLVGNIFFQRIYNIELQKFRKLRQLHHETNKEKHEQLQKSCILMEEHIYSIYYFFYSMCIILFAIFGILTVHLMQQFPRDYYHIHFYWLASVGIAFGLDHLICDPLMTLIFGRSDFYRSRGYYYNGELGELARLAD